MSPCTSSDGLRSYQSRPLSNACVHSCASTAAASVGPGEGWTDPRPCEIGSPPSVIRGAKLHEAVQVSGGIDTLTVRGSEKNRHRAEAWLREKFGQLSACPGRNFYRSALRAECGAVLWYDPPWGEDGQEPHCTIHLTGDVLALVGSGVRIQWLRELVELGFRIVTRIDLCIDWQGVGLDLVGSMHAACERGELCHARLFDPRAPKTARGDLKGYTLYLGRRGKDGSGRFVRAYDKGLESGTGAYGERHRLEVQYSGDCAFTVAHMLLAADRVEDESGFLLIEWNGVKAVKGWMGQLVALVLGAVDFRVANGAKSLKRRPRSPFWDDVLAGVDPQTVVHHREEKPLLERTARWLVKSGAVGRIRSLVEVSGRTAVEAFADLETFIGRAARAGQAVELGKEYMEWLEGQELEFVSHDGELRFSEADRLEWEAYEKRQKEVLG